MAEREDGLKALKFSFSVEWQGREGFFKLGEDRVVVIYLTRGADGQYFKVAIFSKMHGEIVSKAFMFSRYLVANDKSKIEAVPGYYPALKEHKGLWVWDYTPGRPESTEPLCEAIEAWIDVWR